MTDAECVTLLEWALPRRGLRWAGFRNLRGQVCKRLNRRVARLGLAGAADYRARLEADPEEWEHFEALCVVTISRFFRDRMLWDALRDEVLPALAHDALAAGEAELRCWSVGCASGEEPYSLSILWGLALAARFPGLRLRLLGTDLDEQVIARARAALYPAGTLRELPAGWREQAFEPEGDAFSLRAPFRAAVELRREDVRRQLPDGGFRLILCRNLAFTYFDEPQQRETLGRLLSRLSPGGALVIGIHEQLPAGTPLQPWAPQLGIHRAVPAG